MCFSFRCGIEYHAPTDCDVIKKWLTKCADDSETANYISAHTKDVRAVCYKWQGVWVSYKLLEEGVGSEVVKSVGGWEARRGGTGLLTVHPSIWSSIQKSGSAGVRAVSSIALCYLIVSYPCWNEVGLPAVTLNPNLCMPPLIWCLCQHFWVSNSLRKFINMLTW
jgi:hypothetical protein